jgi:hypothetical protein
MSGTSGGAPNTGSTVDTGPWTLGPIGSGAGATYPPR